MKRLYNDDHNNIYFVQNLCFVHHGIFQLMIGKILLLELNNFPQMPKLKGSISTKGQSSKQGQCHMMTHQDSNCRCASRTLAYFINKTWRQQFQWNAKGSCNFFRGTTFHSMNCCSRTIAFESLCHLAFPGLVLFLFW